MKLLIAPIMALSVYAGTQLPVDSSKTYSLYQRQYSTEVLIQKKMGITQCVQLMQRTPESRCVKSIPTKK